VQVAVPPTQNDVLVSEIGSGSPITVKGAVTKLAPIVYVIVVLPAVIAVAAPVAFMDAIAGLLLDHVPPAPLSVRNTVLPAQVVTGPDIALIAAKEANELIIAMNKSIEFFFMIFNVKVNLKGMYLIRRDIV